MSDNVRHAVCVAIRTTLFALGPEVRYATVGFQAQTRLHALGLQNIFLATGLLGVIQSMLRESTVITAGLEERIAHDPTMTIGDLIESISNTNP